MRYKQKQGVSVEKKEESQEEPQKLDPMPESPEKVPSPLIENGPSLPVVRKPLDQLTPRYRKQKVDELKKFVTATDVKLQGALSAAGLLSTTASPQLLVSNGLQKMDGEVMHSGKMCRLSLELKSRMASRLCRTFSYMHSVDRLQI